MFIFIRNDEEPEEKTLGEEYKTTTINCYGFRKQVNYIEVTAENLEKYKFEEVIFPLVGNQILMPKNKHLHEMMINIMKEDGITMEHFDK